LRVRGFVHGDDYLDRLGNLEAAFLKPEPGELVHPWRGRLSVFVESYELTHDLSGGVGEFELACVVAGLETRPVILVITETDIIERGELAIVAARESSVEATARYTAIATSYLKSALTAFYVAEQADFEAALGLVLPASVATSMDGELDVWALAAGAVTDVARLVDYLRRSRAQTCPYSTGTVREEAVRDSCLAFVDHARTVCLARLCQLTAAVTYVSADAAEDTQREVDGLFEVALSVPPDDGLFESLTDLRASFLDGIASIADQLPRLRRVQLLRPLPSLVVSMDLYGTVDREEEIIRLNRVGNPFFVGGDLLVLSS